MTVAYFSLLRYICNLFLFSYLPLLTVYNNNNTNNNNNNNNNKNNKSMILIINYLFATS